MPLVARLEQLRPDLTDPVAAIEAGRVTVDGRIVTNPRALVASDAAVRVERPKRPRGAAKLEAALSAFEVDVRDRIAADVGASTGGFTLALLEAGARRVYAIDAGHGQLLGSLRADPAVVNLERVNLGELDRALVPDVVDIITVDLAYLALADAVPQLERLHIADGAELIALVKPMYELRLARPPTDRPTLDRAAEAATNGIERAGWRVIGTTQSPVQGARGAVELLLHARRR